MVKKLLVIDNEGAAVRVTGTVSPGVYIEICHVPYAVSKPLSKVEFRLDKESGSVIPKSLSGRR